MGTWPKWARRCFNTPWVGVVADAAHLGAGGVRPVTGRIGGHRFERFVGPPGPVPADPKAIGTDCLWATRQVRHFF
jgi:hypothetical protein